jgi:hypothetical protein
MTDCALAAPAPTARATRRRRRPALPPGVPRWAWLFGVTVVPLTRDDTAPRAWVVSAGAGTSHTAALVFDEPDHD